MYNILFPSLVSDLSFLNMKLFCFDWISEKKACCKGKGNNVIEFNIILNTFLGIHTIKSKSMNYNMFPLNSKSTVPDVFSFHKQNTALSKYILFIPQKPLL